VVKALQVVIAAIGSEAKPESIAVIAHELGQYPEPMVLGALARCKLECKFRLSLADVIERMDDGHPGPDEAWELVPKTERETAVLTQEIVSSIPWDLVNSGDLVAARMAFRETYKRAVQEARASRRGPQWFPSLGTDPSLRAPALEKAQQQGRMGATAVRKLLPPSTHVNPEIEALLPDFSHA
jgi:hypothetical protein